MFVLLEATLDLRGCPVLDLLVRVRVCKAREGAKVTTGAVGDQLSFTRIKRKLCAKTSSNKALKYSGTRLIERARDGERRSIKRVAQLLGWQPWRGSSCATEKSNVSEIDVSDVDDRNFRNNRE